jgi:hypothetical protein
MKVIGDSLHFKDKITNFTWGPVSLGKGLSWTVAKTFAISANFSNQKIKKSQHNRIWNSFEDYIKKAKYRYCSSA